MRTRTHVVIDDRDFVLAAGRDLVALMTHIEEAARTQPTFVDIGCEEHPASVLISDRTRVVISVERVTPVEPEPDPPGSQDVLPDWDL